MVRVNFPFIDPASAAKFLKLGNLTSGFKHPCVADLKMGRVTYDQEATPEKIAHEVEKYPPLKKLGYQITGMMVTFLSIRIIQVYRKFERFFFFFIQQNLHFFS